MDMPIVEKREEIERGAGGSGNGANSKRFSLQPNANRINPIANSPNLFINGLRPPLYRLTIVTWIYTTQILRYI